MQLKSIFERIAPQVFEMNDLNQAKQFIQGFVSDTRIKESDKTLILSNLSEIKTIGKLQQYICNSLLKYEGMGLH